MIVFKIHAITALSNTRHAYIEYSAYSKGYFVYYMFAQHPGVIDDDQGSYCEHSKRCQEKQN